MCYCMIKQKEKLSLDIQSCLVMTLLFKFLSVTPIKYNFTMFSNSIGDVVYVNSTNDVAFVDCISDVV